MIPRADGRLADQLRPLAFDLSAPSHAAGRVLASMGQTVVLCTCMVENKVPDFLASSGQGWLTAEYAMLPGATLGRKPRDRGGKTDGRSVEIQRLIGRALRAVVDLARLGERTLWIDCDVLRADGGTRTASINGGYLALMGALRSIRKALGVPLDQVVRDSVAAVSVGLVGGQELLDLDYGEDKDAEVDLNLIMTGRGDLIEVQAAGEEATFTSEQMDRMLNLGKLGIARIAAAQKQVFDSLPALD
jgi:ribonuclease PH